MKRKREETEEPEEKEESEEEPPESPDRPNPRAAAEYASSLYRQFLGPRHRKLARMGIYHPEEVERLRNTGYGIVDPGLDPTPYLNGWMANESNNRSEDDEDGKSD